MTDTQYALIQNTNLAVNQDHEYESDASGYRVGEFWTIMGAGDKGDCEDFALTKLDQLYTQGIPIQNMQIAWGQTETGANHAFLIIRTANKGDIVLDNRFDSIKNVNTIPYRIQAYQSAGQTWKAYTVQLESVTIDYMDCNAGAFADGDRVLVQFENQNWDEPLVIGFESEPVECTLKGFLRQGFPYDGSSFKFNPPNNTFSELTDQPIHNINPAAFGSQTRNKVFICGGQAEGSYWNDTYEYNVNDEAWSSKQDMLNDRGNSKAFTINNVGFVCCGFETGGGFPNPELIVNRVEKYSIDTNSWASSTSHPNSIYGFDTWQLNGKGYTVGGLNASALSNSIYEFNATGESWTSKQTLASAWARGATFITTQKGYYVGGVTADDLDGMDEIFIGPPSATYFNKRCYQYNPITNVLTRMADMFSTSSTKTPLDSMASGDFTNGYVYGGSSANTSITVGYDETTNSWSIRANLPTYSDETGTHSIVTQTGGAEATI